MLKKSLLAAAIMSTSFGAMADWQLSTASPVTIAQEVFADGSKLYSGTTSPVIKLNLGANDVVDMDANEELELTFTLPPGVVFPGNVNVADLTVNSNPLNQITNPIGGLPYFTVTVKDGGVQDATYVTFSIIANENLDLDDVNIGIDVSGLSYDSSGGYDLDLPDNFAAKVQSSLVYTGTNPTFEEDVVLGPGQTGVMFKSTSGYSFSVAPLDAGVNIDFMNQFAGPGNLGVITLDTVAGVVQIDGTPFSFLRTDVLTINVLGNMTAFTDVTLPNAAGTINSSVVADDKQSWELKYIDGTYLTGPLLSDNIQLVASNQVAIPLTDYSVSASLKHLNGVVGFSEVVLGSVDLQGVSSFGRAMTVTPSGSPTLTTVRLTNTSDVDLPVYAQLSTADGEVRPLVQLDDVPANSTAAFFSSDLEDALGGTFERRATIDFKTTTAAATAQDVQVINLLQSRNGVQVQVTQTKND